MKTVAILQSSYIPWKGYFDIIDRVDEFILYDDAQYTRHDWRNRNRIKTRQGFLWLTIPIRSDGNAMPRMCEAQVADRGRWATKHVKSLEQSYSKAPFFADVFERLEPAYRSCATEPRLSAINRRFIDLICSLLEIDTEISWSMDYELSGDRSGKLVDLCRQAGAQRYLSGPSARDYLDESRFTAAGIELEYIEYSGYPEYPQLHGEFEHRVSALDLLFHCGSEARRYLRR